MRTSVYLPLVVGLGSLLLAFYLMRRFPRHKWALSGIPFGLGWLLDATAQSGLISPRIAVYPAMGLLTLAGVLFFPLLLLSVMPASQGRRVQRNSSSKRP